MSYSSGNLKILREGYLIKSPDSSRYVSFMKKWQRKWFRLMENGNLLYFDTDKSLKPGGTVRLLEDCRLVFDPKTRGLQVNNCIGMEIGENTYYIKAETASSYNGWLKLIAPFADKVEDYRASPDPSAASVRRNTEISAHQRESRTFSTSTKVEVDLHLADKTGWLYKTGPNSKGWNHRFFVLANGKLTYYKTDKAEKSLGTIDLRECIAVTQTSVKKGYGLTVKVPSRTYLISADTETEQEDWITAITMATSLLETSKLSVASVEVLDRCGSGSSQSSVTSRELFTSDSHTATATGHRTEELLNEVQTADQENRPERDSVVQLLEAEVDALRGQVRSLRDELGASNSVTAQLQSELQESVRQREREVHSITVDRENLLSKLLELESTKQSLENVNDSLRLQLDEMREEQGVEAEDMMKVRGELEDAQTALAAAEEDVKTYQQDLSDTQQLLQEIQSVAQGLQSELIRRGDFTPDLIRKNRSLSTTATELLSSLDIPSSPSSSLNTHLELDERPAAAGRYHERREEGDGGTADPPDLPAARMEGEEGKEKREREQAQKLAEERLKWQMEMENLRREYEQKEEVKHAKNLEESRRWELKVIDLEERCKMITMEVEEGREHARELNEARKRVTELESNMRVIQERVTQLQVEKEKALADLINIRKINRTIERKILEMENMGRQENEPSSPPGLENRLKDLSQQLSLVQKERDRLKLQVDKLMISKTDQGFIHAPGDGPTKLSPMVLSRKSRATVAASKHSHAVPTAYTGRSGSVRGVCSPQADSSSQDIPIKPQRPPKAVINSKIIATNDNLGGSRPRTWSSNMFQSIFNS